MIAWLRIGAALLSLAAMPAAQTIAPRAAQSSRVDAFASMQRLDAELLASPSATATLETWCRDHRLADKPLIVANVVRDARKTPTSEQLRRLQVVSEGEVSYRKVRLSCGARVLSEADNWYVPARLTPEINRVLNASTVPFGRAVAALEPSRRTFAARLLWADSARPIPAAIFEHHAVLIARDGKAIAEVAEVYRRELLDDSVIVRRGPEPAR